MKPKEAGFEGRDPGLYITNTSRVAPSKQVYKLRWSDKVPNTDKHNLKNQLIWFCPDNQDPKLIYCNNNNQLFELEFVPTETWMLLIQQGNINDV